MKTCPSLVAIITLGTALAVGAADLAEKKKGPPEWDALFGGAALPLVWQSATAASEKITAALAEKKLEGIPDWAETMHLASHALESQVKVDDPDRQATLADAFRLSARIADDIIAGARADDGARTTEAHNRLKLVLAIAQRYLPKEILNAPPQPVRFARPPAEKKK